MNLARKPAMVGAVGRVGAEAGVADVIATKILTLRKFLLLGLLITTLLFEGRMVVAQTSSWPPVIGKPYPELTLMDANGKSVALSSLKGKVILVEPVGMTCAACQAFSGANRLGSLGKVKPQPDLYSIEEYFPTYTGGIKLTDDRIVYVQILLYNFSMKPPTAADVKAWADHFRYPGKNRLVLAGSKDLISPTTFAMIPGFQLIDRNFILRSDSTGAVPRHNLYEQLMPMVKKVLESK